MYRLQNEITLHIMFSLLLSGSHQSDFPLRKFYTAQMFVLVRMRLRNHADAHTVKRFKRCKGCAVCIRVLRGDGLTRAGCGYSYIWGGCRRGLNLLRGGSGLNLGRCGAGGRGMRNYSLYWYSLSPQNLLTANDQICGKLVVWLPMKKMSSLILLLVGLVFRRYE